MTVRLPPVWFVGCGNMAGAMIEGWAKAGVDFSDAVAIRPRGRKVAGVRTITHLPDEPPPARCVLGFKPQTLGAIAPDLAPRLSDKTVLVSMLAGVEVSTLRAYFPQVEAVVRIMPNLPLAERRGVTGLYSPDASTDLRHRMAGLFGLIGDAIWVDSERELAAIGSLAGAGPAYVARFIAALAKAGVERGLEPALAARIALETVAGTAAMAAATGETMESVAKRVASPNGTTQAGLDILDQQLDQLVGRTLEAASRRGQELAEAARIDLAPSLA